MIHIDRGDAPSELTEDVVHSKTAAFKADPKKVVWRDKYIVEALMNMSHNKCAYCECKLGEESKYMEVEHFHDKKDFPDEVVLWNNLLPKVPHIRPERLLLEIVEESPCSHHLRRW